MKLICSDLFGVFIVKKLKDKFQFSSEIKIPQGILPCGIFIGIVLHSKFCDFSFSKLGISFAYKSTTLSLKDVI